MEFLKNYYSSHPLRSILWVALFFRLVSAIFSTGYGMHDDHFLVVEAAQSWVDGYDYNNWLPENSVDGNPTGHSWFYVGLHFLFFWLMDALGLSAPILKMFLVRFGHALWSMITVYFGFRITLKLSDLEDAKIVGWLLAILWLFPILSVRNMVEMVCIPFLMLTFYYLVQEKTTKKEIILAAIFMGLAIGVRMQTYLIMGGIGLYMLFNKRIFDAIVFGLFTVVTVFFTQIADLFIWGTPFAEMAQYVLYNSTHYNDYISSSWFQYLLVLGGLLIPPVSLFILFGYFHTWRKYLLFFLPTFIFLVFHSAYPNKQERFILPIIPLIIIPGIIGWREFLNTSRFWEKHPLLYKNCIRFFWTLNIIALIFVSPAPTKKSRIESMAYLSELNDVDGILLERTTNYGCYLMPRFYHGDWKIPHTCFSRNEMARYEGRLKEEVESRNINYCMFVEKRDIDQRVEEMKKIYPDMQFVKSFEPSYIDKLLHFLNPRNENETIYLYKLKEA